MDLTPKRAEEIVRYASNANAAVGPRVLSVLLAQLDKERADHQRLVQAYWQQEYQMYLASEEVRQGGETGSNPPPPIQAPADAARMLAPAPGMLCTDEHEPMIGDDGRCGACEILRGLRIS